MIQRRFEIPLLVIVLCAVSQSHLQGQELQASAPGKPPVEVFLIASGKNGLPALLAQSDLAITVDKQPVQVSSLRSAKDDKLLFAVVIDVSTSSGRQAEWIREAAKQLFQGLSTDGNKGYLVVFDVKARMSDRTLESSEARQVLDRVKFGGGTALFDAIAQTSATVLSKSRNPEIARRVIVLLSDGDDNQSRTRPQQAEQLADREGVSIFCLGTSIAHGRGEEVLQEFAKETGGQAIFEAKLEEGVRTLLAAIDSQSVLSFVQDPPSNRDMHALVVKSSQKDIQISAPAEISLP